MACNHLWRGVNDRSSQCAKCGEIYTTPDPKDARIAALEAELARVTAERDALRKGAERWRDLLTSIRCDIQCLHWHKDIDAAIGARGEKP